MEFLKVRLLHYHICISEQEADCESLGECPMDFDMPVDWLTFVFPSNDFPGAVLIQSGGCPYPETGPGFFDVVLDDNVKAFFQLDKCCCDEFTQSNKSTPP